MRKIFNEDIENPQGHDGQRHSKVRGKNKNLKWKKEALCRHQQSCEDTNEHPKLTLPDGAKHSADEYQQSTGNVRQVGMETFGMLS